MELREITFRSWAADYGVSRLSSQLGVSRITVHRWVSGAHRPAVFNAVRIVEISSGSLRLDDIYNPQLMTRGHADRR